MNKWLKAAQKLRVAMDKAGTFLTDLQALEVSILYAPWQANIKYKAGDRCRYEGVLYKVLMDHISQETWVPTNAPSLYAKILTDENGAILPWEQPGSTNGYRIGDKVSYNNKIWVSLIDNNTWEPGVIGTENIWSEVSE